MFKSLLERIEIFGTSKRDLGAEEKFFSNIVGYSDIKKLLLRSVVARIL
jgi:hypothetical protein